MLQYKIPQDIGIEDKIVGPFSLRQLGIVGAGGGISYVIFAISSKFYELNTLEYIVLLIPFLLSLAVALLKINSVTFTKFVLLAMEFSIKPKQRMWDHRGISDLVAPNLNEEPREAERDPRPAVGEGKKVNLEDLSHILDSGGAKGVASADHQDLDKAKDDDLITEAFFGHRREESATQNMYWRTKESQKKRLDLLAKLPSQSLAKAEKSESDPSQPLPGPEPAIPLTAPSVNSSAAPYGNFQVQELEKGEIDLNPE